ncbi:hypothetical protein SAMN05444411_10980 [Lutibacter oricola]|uniref:Uncharacterized protein n=1 Tax=Lutibacter oricola TaxID=762486 RepID=A0A1H3EH80_9FLAO|nr:hypothetical protein [Lutibacter oricola]SDX77284.1 hypothetical protein SAMN05444411_10980 [Lutibacter oricola]
MNATQLSSPPKKHHLKVVKNNVKNSIPKRVYINTLMPNFAYYNEKEELVLKNNCILL